MVSPAQDSVGKLIGASAHKPVGRLQGAALQHSSDLPEKMHGLFLDPAKHNASRFESVSIPTATIPGMPAGPSLSSP